jgi:D-alanyl-D-alanine dipeptidase
MSKIAKRICLTLLICVLLLGAAAVGVVGYWLPYQQAENTMPAGGTFVLTQLEDGSTQITWPWGVNARYHVLEIISPADQVIYTAQIEGGASCILPSLPETEELTIRVRSANTYTFPFEKNARIRYGERAMEVTDVFAAPALQKLEWTADAEAKTVDVQLALPVDGTCRMYYVEPDGTKWQMPVVEGELVQLTFGENQQFPVPEIGDSHTFAFDVVREGEGYTYQGVESGRFSVTREDLLGTKLRMGYVGEGHNVFTFFWNETKGEHYELQQYDDKTDAWVTVCSVAQGQPHIYTTGHLPRYGNHRFRVVALGGQTLPDSEFAAEPDEVSVSTGASLIYSTIWPIETLNIYSAPDRQAIVGTADAAKAYCVLDEEDGMFQVRYEDGFGWIDSNYCMINLPDLIGDLCLYDIVNSYDSLYMAHEYEIPDVTGEVIVGYERVLTETQEYLVPLLYPAALKLEKAAFAAMEQGYKLKIYDSFRPKEATRNLFDQTATLASEAIPEDTYTGKILTDLPKLADGEVLTYEMLMTDMGRYTLSYFLASTGSRHNQGIAMDLTLVDMETGEELQMQTSMHDLSWYSEQARNNGNAKILAQIMKAAGFTGIVSEWWHFQDDEAKDALEPEYLWDGVTPQGWVADDYGWRYRSARGVFWTDCSEYIDGVLYAFDADGYVQQE